MWWQKNHTHRQMEGNAFDYIYIPQGRLARFSRSAWNYFSTQICISSVNITSEKTKHKSLKFGTCGVHNRSVPPTIIITEVTSRCQKNGIQSEITPHKCRCCQFEGTPARRGLPTPPFGTGIKTSLKAVRRISFRPASVRFKAYVTRH